MRKGRRGMRSKSGGGILPPVANDEFDGRIGKGDENDDDDDDDDDEDDADNEDVGRRKEILMEGRKGTGINCSKEYGLGRKVLFEIQIGRRVERKRLGVQEYMEEYMEELVNERRG